MTTPELQGCYIGTNRGMCIIMRLWSVRLPQGERQLLQSARNEMQFRQDARSYLEGRGLDMVTAHRYPCPPALSARAQFDSPTLAEMQC
jgi:hypothetical protein